ncbi:MAG: alpha/beta hydrolase [Limisphaerales bacterium]
MLRTTGSRRLVVLVHGLASNQNEHIFFNAARCLAKNTYDSFRFAFYGEQDKMSAGGQNKTRRFRDTTLRMNAADLGAVLKRFQGAYTQIYIVAHSLGCPIVLLSDILPNVRSLVFWEPSRQPQDIFRQSTFCSERHAFVLETRQDILVGTALFDDAMTFPSIPQMLKKINIPLQIICAGKGGHEVGRDLYFKNANCRKEFYVIPYANHSFDENGAEEDLFEHMLTWLRITAFGTN